MVRHSAFIILRDRSTGESQTMKFRGLLCAGVLVFSGLSFAGNKVYHITLSFNTLVGQTQLKAGKYKVSVDGSNAVFELEEGSKRVTVPVKIQNTKTKFNDTKVRAVTEGDATRLKAIDIGGSDTELEF